MLPHDVSRSVRVLAWASFVLQVVLIGTGGAVRLTASGLGCPTWPECTDRSFVNTPEMGIHGVIEFSNRMLTFVLAVVVIAMFLAVVRNRRERRDLFTLALVQGLSIPFQAVLGGITVLTGLNPYVVGAHFVVSIALVVVTVVLVYRVRTGPRGTDGSVGGVVVPLAHLTSFFVAVTVMVGILTTGAGPHAGDNSNPDKLAPRNGLDPVVLQHVHSWPAYVTFGLTILLVALLWRRHSEDAVRRTRRFAGILVSIELVQIAVGVTQARTGLPVGLVGIHMVLAALLVAAMTALILSLRVSRPKESGLRAAESAAGAVPRG
nr:COX15/CtaA family protein [Galbitalea soli]